MTTKLLPPVNKELIVGIDAGGTKIHIADTLSTLVRRYNTSDYENLDAVLEDYFDSARGRPSKVMVGMAGARNDETGEILLTNTSWPTFNPQAASKKYGIEISIGGVSISMLNTIEYI